MKLALLLTVLLFSTATLGQSYNSDKPKNWIDITDKAYSGKDIDLNGFKLIQPEVSCDYLLRKCAITWNNSRSRMTPFNCGNNCSEEELKSYTMHFKILDRHDKTVFEGSRKWDIDVRGNTKGFVDPFNPYIELGELNLNNSTVQYWAQRIVWKRKITKKPKTSPDKTAFTLKEALSKENTIDMSQGNPDAGWK